MPTLSHAWASAWLETRVEPQETWRCHFAYEGDRLVGVLPVVRRARGWLAGFELAPPRDHHTRSGDVLLAPGHARATFTALLDAAFRADGHPYRLALSGVRGGSPTLVVLAEGAPRGARVRRPDARGAYVPGGGTIGEFRAKLSDNFRRNVRKAGNRLEKTPGAVFVFEDGPNAKPEGSTPSSPSRARAGRARRAPRSRRTRASSPLPGARPQPVRAGLARVEPPRGGRQADRRARRRALGRSLVLLKIAYDEAYARLSPGNCLFDRVIERELAAKTVDEVNCLTDMPWHRSWEMPQADFHDLWVYPRRPGALLVGVLPQRAKAAAKRVPFLVKLPRSARPRRPPRPPPHGCRGPAARPRAPPPTTRPLRPRRPTLPDAASHRRPPPRRRRLPETGRAPPPSPGAPRKDAP
jgi:hypothetical protein